jgi:hypothetical protein
MRRRGPFVAGRPHRLHGLGLGAVHLRQEQPHAEGGAHADLALHGELAAHQVGEHLGDGEAQAGAGSRLCRAFAARERLEHARDLGRRHAGAGVRDLDVGHLAGVPHAQADLSLRR